MAYFCYNCEGDEMHFFFDEKGIKLNLQTIFVKCYGINVYKVNEYNDEKGLCFRCLQQMAEDYDLMLKTDNDFTCLDVNVIDDEDDNVK